MGDHSLYPIGIASSPDIVPTTGKAYRDTSFDGFYGVGVAGPGSQSWGLGELATLFTLGTLDLRQAYPDHVVNQATLMLEGPVSQLDVDSLQGEYIQIRLESVDGPIQSPTYANQPPHGAWVGAVKQLPGPSLVWDVTEAVRLALEGSIELYGFAVYYLPGSSNVLDDTCAFESSVGDGFSVVLSVDATPRSQTWRFDVRVSTRQYHTFFFDTRIGSVTRQIRRFDIRFRTPTRTVRRFDGMIHVQGVPPPVTRRTGAPQSTPERRRYRGPLESEMENRLYLSARYDLTRAKDTLEKLDRKVQEQARRLIWGDGRGPKGLYGLRLPGR